MTVLNVREWRDTSSSSWDACMTKLYCKWPVIAGIIIGGILLIPIIWGCTRLICCRSSRRKGPKGDQFPKQPPLQGYQPVPPPKYDDPKVSQFDGSNSGIVKDDDFPPKSSWDQAGQRKGPNGGHDEDVELGRLEPVHVQDAPEVAHHAPTPMARLSHINTRNLHDSLHRPHQSLHASQNSQDVQNPFRDPPSAEFPLRRNSPPASPQLHSPYSPQPPPVPYSPQRPYSPYSPYTTGNPKYESPMFIEPQQSYRAYSPSISTQNEASPAHNEPVELASPFNMRPASIAFARDSQLHLAENKRTSGAWLSQPDREPVLAPSSLLSEGNEKPDALQLPQSGTQQAPSSAPPAAVRLSQAPGRAL